MGRAEIPYRNSGDPSHSDGASRLGLDSMANVPNQRGKEISEVGRFIEETEAKETLIRLGLIPGNTQKRVLKTEKRIPMPRFDLPFDTSTSGNKTFSVLFEEVDQMQESHGEQLSLF